MLAGSAAAAAVVVALGWPGGASAAPSARALQGAAQAVIDAGGSGILIRMHDGTRIRTVTAGVGDQDTGRRVKNKDQYQIGSQTKTFMAVLALQLVAEGRVDLDESIETYLPGVVPGGDAITVRMLLQHTSGLDNYTDNADLLEVVGQDPYYPLSVETALDSAFAAGPGFAPGTAWEYSNTGYLIIGRMLEQVSGMPVAELLRRRITGPRGLNQTYLPGDHVPDTGPGFIRGYLYDIAGEPAGYLPTSEWAVSYAWTAGAMVSTARDLSEFYSDLVAGRILGPDELAEMMTTVVDSGAETFDAQYGLGIYPVSTPCGSGWGHSGGIFGHLSETVVSPDGERWMALDTSGVPVIHEESQLPAVRGWEDALVNTYTTAFCAMQGTDVPTGTPMGVASTPGARGSAKLGDVFARDHVWTQLGGRIVGR